MALSIRYFLRARHEEIKLLDNIIRKFGHATAKKIYDEIENTLNRLSIMPEMYGESVQQKGLRKCVFSKQTSIYYYRIQEDHIEIVSFRPNRQDSKKFEV